MPTTASSKVMDGREEPEDAEAVARLRAAGAIFLGKTSTHEFALGVTTPQSRNPWDPERLPGGSSGGSAIAVASGMGLGSLGTDTRASIRVPAALCGVVGLKPTFGLVPTRGMVTLSWSMDHVAPIAKTAEDAGLLLEVLAGSRSGVRGETGTDAALAAVRAAGSDLRIGVPLAARRENHAAVALAFDEALGVLRGLGLNVVDVDEPNGEDFALANAAGLIVSRVEAAAYHEPWRGRRADYTDDVRGQLDEARKATGVAYVQAQRYRSRLSRQMLHLFDRFDLLAMPTCKIPAPYPEESDEMLLVLSETCIPWSFIGFPAISLPCGAAPGNLPIGLELVAAPNADALLLAVAAAFESAAAVSYV
jgi:aspartyl-tRNA(Asn)/glutamyl-tRNA(Gln) amidotransferase subunit A